MVEGVKRRRRFRHAFNRAAIDAIPGGRSASRVAAEPGPPHRLVRSWLRWAEGRSPEVTRAPTPPAAGIGQKRTTNCTQASGMTAVAQASKTLSAPVSTSNPKPASTPPSTGCTRPAVRAKPRRSAGTDPRAA